MSRDAAIAVAPRRGRAGVGLAALRRPSAARGDLAFGASVVALAALAAAALIGAPGLHRWIVALAIAANLAVVAVCRPRLAVLAMLAFLPLMALVRRIETLDAPWTSQDPLVLVVPGVVTLLCAHLFLVQRRPLVRGPASLLVVALVAIGILEVGNPSGGGIAVGASGLIFLAVPLGWFFIGRELGDRALVRSVMVMVAAMGIPIAIYGLLTTQLGFPIWDRNWMDAVDFQVLNVGTSTAGSAIRPFGTFSAPSEYLYWLGAMIVFSITAFYERRSALVLVVPLGAVALFLGSGRTPLILTVLAVMVMTILRVLKGRRALVPILAAVLVTGGLLLVAGPLLSRVAAGSSDPAVAHQGSGLGNPLDESSSTLPTHFRAFRQGIESGVRNPLGQGTGAASHTADTLGSSGTTPQKTTVDDNGADESLRGTDADISNVFLSLGAAGGFVYLALLCVLARALLRRYGRWRDPILLGIIGFSVLLSFEWLRGEQYAISALTWFLLGWATRSQDDPRLDEAVAPRAAAAGG
ncbi:MAG: hypothetical protein QOJ35_3091 [Solirubrobacteraceae bacterium]|nr:hypothetical protein [Solirubrobacteraceae bacterium]